MIGRQHLFLFHKYFDIEDRDKVVVDINRLQKIRMKNADLWQYLFEWDKAIGDCRKCPDDATLLSSFAYQVGTQMPSTDAA